MIIAPLATKNIFRTAEWGGSNVTQMFNFSSPHYKTSEVWTASALSKGKTSFSFPSYGNISFEFDPSFLYERQSFPFGTNCKKYKEFPLLAKWIDANDNLSVQVHPDDEYAEANCNSYGKTEAWYIVSAKPNAKIVYGLKPGTTKDDVKKALVDNKIETVLNYVPVQKGEIYYIPAGMLHALLDGVIVYEIQQSCDITFRLFDWGRDRPLQPEEAIEVIKYDKNSDFISSGLKTKNSKTLKTPFFKFSVIEAKNKTFYTSKKSFVLCSSLNGEFIIKTDNYLLDTEIGIHPGESFIFPAAQKHFGKTKVAGTGTILVTTVE